ncbi:Hypothetical predicted protein [Octopus vulgaris]|uniref:PBZ-type domain-containing protein n=1 Tax=Octopus vulgaris TaxID=6645 RepID=A0AA36BPA2_OCTVU|nr:Hypothetical predicted protein [Octopus vulgaris]
MAAVSPAAVVTAKQDKRPMCKYGEKCYRKNPNHLREYRHPSKPESEDQQSQNDQDNTEPSSKKPKLDPHKTGSISDDDDDDDVSRESGKTSDDAKQQDESVPGTSGESSKPVDEGSQDKCEEELTLTPPPSPEDIKDNIREKFLFDMPDDFYELWKFCEATHPENPTNCFSDVLGFQLVGPFDILAGKHKELNGKNSKGRYPNYLIHWRYYLDPPEFQTVIRGNDTTQFHLGYFRDVPTEAPVFVAANSAKEGPAIIPRGENLFAALSFYLGENIKSKKLFKPKQPAALQLQSDLTEWAKKLNLNLELKTKSMKERDKKTVCKAFHGAGIVVKLDKNEVGYRPIPETPAALKKMFQKILDSKTEEDRNQNFEPLQELMTLIQFANDECDYGEGLELGINLFCFGGDIFNSTIQFLLPLAYQLLQHPQFSQIITEHLKHRKMSALPHELNELN